MVDDLLLNKVAAIERAVRRVRALTGHDDAGADPSQTRLDAIVLGLQRACEGCVDAAMHMVREQRLGVPQETRHAFDLLERARLIDPELALRMKKTVELRNRLIHDYASVSHDEIHRAAAEGLDDVLTFTARALVLAVGPAGADPSAPTNR